MSNGIGDRDPQVVGSPIMLLHHKAVAVAAAVAAHRISHAEAIRPLRRYAVETGLTDSLGWPAVEQIIRAPFQTRH